MSIDEPPALISGSVMPFVGISPSTTLMFTNAWIVTKEGKVVTRQADHAILKGITRGVVLEAMQAQGLELEERPFTVEEAQRAREAFLTSASQLVLPVVQIDGKPVGNGAPGLIASALRRDFHRFAEVS